MLADLMEAWVPTYRELEEYYADHFSLGCLNTSIENKFGLISLICFLTNQARKNNPDATCWQVIMKVMGNEPLDDFHLAFYRGLAVICSDYMLNTTEFMTFGLKNSKQIVAKIREILDTWLPF